ncbi:MAG: hypothetical protein IKO26_00080 [Paludibacteraceae bacterium]|nr:hypothetical protein [Paludibacteraceae bacterium]
MSETSVFFEEHVYDLITICLGLLLSILSWILSKKHNSEQLRSYVPTIWTSLGIFFTFLSIYLTLSKMVSLSDKQIEITTIIRGIIPAFSTSVIGIFGAIVTAYIDRWIKSREEANDNNDFKKFRKGENSTISEAQSPDIILLGLVRKIEESISETHNLLNTISKQTKETLNSNKDSMIQAINDTKDETIKNQNKVQQEQREQLQEYVEKFVSEANNTHREQVEEILAKFNTESEKREKNHIGLLRDLENIAQNYIQLIKNSLCKEAESRQAEMKNFIETEKSELSTFVSGQNGMLEEVLKQSNTTINNAVDKIRDLFETKIIGDVELFAKAFYENCQAVLTTQETNNADYLIKLSSVLQTTHDNITNDINALKDSIILHLNKLNDENTRNMTTILNQHTADYKAVSAGIQELEEKHLNTVSDIYREGEEKVAEALSDQTTQINNALSTYKIVLDNFSSSIISTGQSMAEDQEKFCSKLNSRTEKLEKEHLEIVERIHRESEEKIKVADESLEKEISRMIGTIQELRASVESSSNSYISKHNEIKKQITETTNQLISEISQKFNDSAQIDAIEKACLSLNEKLQLTIKALDQKYQSITESIESVATSITTYSKVADDTILLNEYVHSTIELYKSHSTQIAILEAHLNEMTDTINDALITMQKIFMNSMPDSKQISSDNLK